ncbi:rod shape-determining protein MreD [Nocardioides ferulae]|uniref:rod shape-determining protein MreD n=1 Tax=Nocardioides ferulae TaxID=2340821 RepID=UPI001F0CA3C2|nr:rod shape-determining protein MreD [Nocardioides ferulae]
MRIVLSALALAVALVLQVTVFSHLAWQGVVPNLCLLLVVATALVRGAQPAMLLGFAGGLLLDLAPPADHVAGRWALALVLVGYVAGRMRQDTRPTAVAVVATVAACSFVGTSVFALSGLLLEPHAPGVPHLLAVIGVAVVWDVALTPFVLPAAMAGFRRLDPQRVPA